MRRFFTLAVCLVFLYSALPAYAQTTATPIAPTPTDVPTTVPTSVPLATMQAWDFQLSAFTEVAYPALSGLGIFLLAAIGTVIGAGVVTLVIRAFKEIL